MMRKAILWSVMLVLLAAAVLAAPPTVQFNEPEQISSLTVVYPKVTCIHSNVPVIFPFDVLDGNYSRLIDSDVDCIYVVVDDEGTVLSGSDLTYNSTLAYWHFNLTAEETAIADSYNYYVHCNSSGGENGFVSDSFEISALGDCSDEDRSYFNAIIWLPLVFGLMLMAGAFLLDENEHNLLRMFLFLLSLMTYFASSYFAVQALIRYTRAIEMQDSMTLMVWLMGTMIFVILVYFMMYIFYKLMEHIRTQKMKRLGL